MKEINNEIKEAFRDAIFAIMWGADEKPPYFWFTGDVDTAKKGWDIKFKKLEKYAEALLNDETSMREIRDKSYEEENH